MTLNSYVRKMAQLLVKYTLELKENDLFLIVADHPGMPLVEELFRESLRVGAHPDYLPRLHGLNDARNQHRLNEIYFREASEKHFSHISPLTELAIGRYDAILKIVSCQNTMMLSGIDPKRIAIRARACASVMDTFFSRAASGDLRWCLTVYPTEAHAQNASMSLSDYSKFVFGAFGLDDDDPVHFWQKRSEEQSRIVNRLNRLSRLRIVGKDTDLSMEVEGRTWIDCSGDKNMPDGEIFTGPIEDSANGQIRFSFPGVMAGTEIEDIRLRFKDGEVVEARASKGNDLLEVLIGTDSGSPFIGEIGIGTNNEIDRFTKLMLLDEKIGGTIHIALGNGYPETGSKNKSGIHWDLLCDLRQDGVIYGDDEIIYKNGRFLF